MEISVGGDAHDDTDLAAAGKNNNETYQEVVNSMHGAADKFEGRPEGP